MSQVPSPATPYATFTVPSRADMAEEIGDLFVASMSEDYRALQIWKSQGFNGLGNATDELKYKHACSDS